MNNFKLINNLVGWLMFLVALYTYTVTVEPTAAFWDCSEFIACAYKLQVPHPPGSPLFLMLGRMFALLAGNDKTQVAFWINMMSVVSSALTILFMYWTIVMIGRKVYNKKFTDLSTSETLALFGAGIVGSLAYTFSDTFWFSAVEAEVYAMSSFFTALVVWAGFKWELIEDESAANRWLIFTAYLVGLSIGVHLLNLVVVPALALLYYFKKKENVTLAGGILALGAGFLVLGIINSVIIPGLPSMSFFFEKFFVNSIGLPYGSGAIFFIIALVSGIVFAIKYSIKHGKVGLNVSMLSLVAVLIGYLAYTLALVRSNYNPPINENDPSNLLNYTKYLKREQYGDRSLLYGPIYTAQVSEVNDGTDVYKMKNGKYEVYQNKPVYGYPEGQQMFFPRVYSTSPQHIQMYQDILGKGAGETPTFGDNLYFMFRRQMGHMYMRYFMWNFVGRESDIQDAAWIGLESSKKVPEIIQKNKARNQYYFLPLILGILGFVLLYRKHEKVWLVTILMFLMTGLALVVFINSPPSEPRERDYIYVGSFYFFAIWIGLGVLQLVDILGKISIKGIIVPIIATSVAMAVPVILAQQNWDDHDRSGRFAQMDFAKNMLNSCPQNAILFTGGDNDTFPLWYLQEVEGYRTDVRVCNLSLLGTDWYIDQMKRKTYLSEPLPIKLSKDLFLEGINDQVLFNENPNVKNGIDLAQYLQLLRNDDASIKVMLQDGKTMINSIPSEFVNIPINKAELLQNKLVQSELLPFIPDNLTWSIGKNGLMKPQLLQLEIISNNNWKRPICFGSTISEDSFVGLADYCQLEGYVYRLMPYKQTSKEALECSTKLMEKNLLTDNTFWRGLDNPNVYYHSEFYGVSFFACRINFMKLVNNYCNLEMFDKAKKALDFIDKKVPNSIFPYDNLNCYYIRPYFLCGDAKNAYRIADVIFNRNKELITYYSKDKNANGNELGKAVNEMQIVVSQLEAVKSPKTLEYKKVLDEIINNLNS